MTKTVRRTFASGLAVGLCHGPNYQQPKRPRETKWEQGTEETRRKLYPCTTLVAKTISFHCYGGGRGGDDLSGEGFVAACGSRELRISSGRLLPCWSEALVRPLL